MTQPAIPRDVVPGSPNHPAWLGVGSLALGTLALVTSEFLPASLLSRMGQDLDVSQGSAGQTVTALGPDFLILRVVADYTKASSRTEYPGPKKV